MELHIPTARVFEPLLKPSRYKAAYGGRASGKSHFYAGLSVETMASRRCDFLFVREKQNSLQQSVHKLIVEKITEHNLGADFKIIENKIIHRNTKSEGIFVGMQNHTSHSIKSYQDFGVAWVEEAQTMSHVSIGMLVPTIRSKGSELWFSWNPDQSTDPVDVLFRGENGPPPNSIIVEANYLDNPWVTQESLNDAAECRRRNMDDFRHVWLGQYNEKSDAQVFKNWKVEEFEAPKGADFRFGADWGFAVDPTTLVRCYVDGRRLYVDYEAYMVGCEINQTPDLFAQIPLSDKFFITADSARPETISYMRNHGYPKIASAVKGPNSVKDGVEFLKNYDIIVHPRCLHTIRELALYRYKIDSKTQKVLPVFEDKNNHLIDALRYACEGVRRIATANTIKVTPIQLARKFK